jgi:hypothetical protein
MKISFSNWSLGAWLTNKQAAWRIVALICLLAGSYLVGGYLGFLVGLLLGIAGIMLARTTARLNANNSEQVERVPGWEDVPQVTSRWDYRPRRALRRRVDADLAAETAEGLSAQRSVVNENVWFSALNCLAVDPEPTVEVGTEKAPLPDCADVVSMYDQSPIDNHGVAAE